MGDNVMTFAAPLTFLHKMAAIVSASFLERPAKAENAALDDGMHRRCEFSG